MSLHEETGVRLSMRMMKTARGGEMWLEILGNTCKRFNWRCHAYCQMDNHYHIVIETAEAKLSQGMRQLNSVYT